MPSYWISFGCLMVLGLGLYFISDGLSGKSMPDWAPWRNATGGWKPISSEVRIFLGLAMAYGSFLAFVKDYFIASHPIATETLPEMMVFPVIWFSWPVLLVIFPIAILPWTLILFLCLFILSLLVHWHMSRGVQILNRTKDCTLSTEDAAPSVEK